MINYKNCKICCGKTEQVPDAFSKMYVGRHLVDNEYIGEVFKATSGLKYIQLSDYLDIEAHEGSNWVEVDIINNSDRVVYMNGRIWMCDSDGEEYEETYEDYEILPGQTGSAYVESYYILDWWECYLELTAVKAEDVIYEY